MAFTVTARHTGTSGTTAAQTHATNSTTPTASSLLLVFAGVQSDSHSTAHSWQLPTGGGWTYTQIAATAMFNWETTTLYPISSAMWRAPVSGSPAAHTVTVDGWSGSLTGTYSEVSCDITGHNSTTPVAQFKTGGAVVNPTSNTASGTVTLDATPTTGNLVVVGFSAGNDVAGAFTAPTIGGQSMTQLHNITNNYTHSGLWYRVITGAESNATITCTDLGETVGDYAVVAVEIAIAGGGGSNFTQTPTDNLGLTDSMAVDQSKTVVDNLGLTDSAALENGKLQSLTDNLGLTDTNTALDFGANVANDLGLTDSVALSLGRTAAAVDNLGLTDSAALSFGRASADTLGLTDASSLVLNYTQTPADSLGLSDSTQVSLSGAGSVSPTDNLGLTDTTSLSVGSGVLDSEGLSDSVTLVSGFSSMPADSVSLTDAVSMVVDYRPSDAEGLSDNAQVSLSGSGAVTAAGNLALTDSQAFDRTHSFFDTSGLTDSAMVVMGRVLADLESLTDSAQVSLSGSGSPTDNLGLSDTATVDQAHVYVDVAGATDSAAVLLATVRAIIDNAALNDLALVQLNPVSDVTIRPYTGRTIRPNVGTTQRP